MKRFTTTLVLLLLASLPMMAERVTPETARKAASNFLNNNGAKSVQLTDLSKAAGFANLYIFTAEQGFVVMAADDCVQPILGYSLTGKFVAENMPTNVSGWLQGYSDEIQYAIDSKAKASAETAKLWKDLIYGNSKASTSKATAIVPNLLKTEWDQDPLYNNFCPYDNTASELTVTGCVATAMAQILKYWDYPTSGTGSHSYTHSTYGLQSANYGSTTYNWENMPAYLSSSSTTEQINEVARLMYHCGVSVNMTYGLSVNGGSSASTQMVGNALMNYFKYSSGITYKEKSSYTDANWKSLVKAELNAGRPLQYRGSSTSGGHSFVCCGYDSDDKFYFNWGWSGRNDGFYALNSLVPGSGGSGGGSYSFTQNQAALFGIQPMATTTFTPTNFNLATEGRNAVLTWDASENAASYYVYRDGLVIANTTATTYTDNNLGYGSYDYCIKSRDANGASPAPTETLTADIEPKPTNLTLTTSGNNATLNWTAPEWCLPSTDEEVLTYGDGSFTGRFGYGAAGAGNIYFGHKYPASMLEINKVIYKVSFYATEPGTFQLFIYTATVNNSRPQTQIHNQSITALSTGWIDIAISDPIEVDPTKDLWVFIYDPEARAHPMGYNSTVVTNGNYCSFDPNNPTSYVNTQNVLFLIRTCITDGDFTYNLYQDGTKIAQDLSTTTYSATLNDNNANLFAVKTNFKGGETTASNAIGFAKGTASVANLEMAANDKMTVTEGSQLTVSGTMSNANADNLIIENGAQLIHNSEGVKATVKKEIAKYTVQGDDENLSNGWYLLASPMTENIEASTGNGLLTNDYDLYYFDQSEEKEWRNHKIKAFELENGKGYLYANSGNTTLSFAGTLAETATATPLAYDANATTLKGFNLIGNPFACNATVERDFYVMNESMNEVTLAGSGRQIAPCEGIFVQAKGENESVSFTKATASAKGTYPKDCFDVVVTQGRSAIDRTRVRLGEGIGMEKFSLDNNHTQISLWQDGQQLAVACANGENEMPLNFKAAKNGTYTLAFEVEKLDLDYLHLIDNMTGNEVDVLAMPTYTFAAKTTDYASRFRLVFSNCEDAIGDNDEDAPFAYVSNGEIRLLVETCQGASLQVVDMTGRVIRNCADVARNVSTSEMSPGVHVLRLIDGDNVRTQKIVIE
ncbi:MAG: C10 family peptidase [Bacteroidales bacterium]|nr:C10 family peptidase [Bacteroidales bacterium]